MANPTIAAITSFIIPGVGQMYAGDIKRGVIFLIIAIIFFAIRHLSGFIVSLIFVVITIIYNIYVANDAYQIASA